MSVFEISAANVLGMWRRFVGLMILLSIALALCVTAFAISGSAAHVAHERVQEGAVARSITVDRLLDRPDAPMLGNAAVTEFSSLPHVTAVEPRAQVSFGYKDKDIPGVLLYATTLRPSLAPPIVRSTRSNLFPLQQGEAVLPAESDGSKLDPLLGRTVTVETTVGVAAGQGRGQPQQIKIVGLFDPTWQLDGPDAAYLDAATVVRWSAARAGVTEEQFLDNIGYDKVTVLADSAGQVDATLRLIQAKGFGASTLEQEFSALPGVLELIRVVGQLLLVVLAIVAMVGAVVVTGALARQRTREIGILKAVGFGNSAILRMFVTEMGVVGVVAVLAGSILGVAGATLAAALLRREPTVASFVTAAVPLPSISAFFGLALVTIVVTVGGALLPASRAAKLAPSDAIREW